MTKCQPGECRRYFEYSEPRCRDDCAYDEPAAPLRNARNWPEDFQQENGNYECACSLCGSHFIGNKHLVVCRVCAGVPAATSGAVVSPMTTEHALTKQGLVVANAQIADLRRALDTAKNRLATESHLLAECEHRIKTMNENYSKLKADRDRTEAATVERFESALNETLRSLHYENMAAAEICVGTGHRYRALTTSKDPT